MSTDKLRALNETLTEILSEPSSPPTFFDEEPHNAARDGEQVAKAPDNLPRGSEIPREKLGKPNSREFGFSPRETREENILRDARSPGMARQPAVANNRISAGRWALRGFAGLLLVIGVAAAAIIWSKSSGDAANTASSRDGTLAQAVPTAAVSPEVTPLLQSMAHDLASVGKEIEQFKAGRELLARDNANLSEQLRATQEQLTRAVAGLSEQLKASQEQLARENAKVAEQIQGIQEQLISVMSRTSEQNAPRRIAATPRPAPLLIQPAAAAARKPAPALSSAQAVAQPKVEKPKPPSTSRPPAPAR